MAKRQRIVRVPENYYYRAHETRYHRILGSGSVFRQKRMSPNVAKAWAEFCSSVDLPSRAMGVEFGSGTGINTITIAEQGYEMLGLDISPTAVRKARELAEERDSSARFMVGDMFNSGLAAESFDFAVNIWTLHVVGEQNLRDQHLRECLRVLKRGGHAFLHNESSEEDILDPDEEIVIQETSEWNIREYTNRFDLPDGTEVEISFPGHVPPGLSGRRSLGEHVQELERAGFRVLRCWADVMRPQPDVPGNRVMVAFAQRPMGGRN